LPTGTHLIGAYGLHWSRKEVDWHPGSGRQWQMLGRLHDRRPNLRICDFRTAAGVYVLERGGHPVYAGLARGSLGIGARLRGHTQDATKTWNHFSWFSFDDVRHNEPRVTYAPYPGGWAQLHQRDVLGRTTMSSVVGELEALLINLMIDKSLVNIQRPSFPHADQWKQIGAQNYNAPGICHRVAREPFRDKSKFDA
jgi:hypothetical protein